MKRPCDKWEAKSSPRAFRCTECWRQNTDRKTAGGVDAIASTDHLYEETKRLKIPGGSLMNKKRTR